MTKEEMNAAGAAQQAQAPQEPVAPETEAPAADAEATAETAEAPAVPDYGADFRNEYTSKYPDEDLSGDEAYYNHLRDRLKERDGYEEGFTNLSNAVGRSEDFDAMMKAAKDDPNFDPVIWMVSTGRLDIDALQRDPEYAKKLTDAQQKSLATKAKARDLQAEGEKNLQPSLDLISRICEEEGVDDETRKQAIRQMYQIMEDLIVNKVDESTFRTVLKGLSHDNDVAEADEGGYARGQAKNINDKLRTFPKSERNGGTQAPRQEPEPENGNKYNMFGL